MINLPSLPEGLQRRLIKTQLKSWSNRLLANENVEEQHFFKNKMVKIFRDNEKIAEDTDLAKEQHYEVPTEFFKLRKYLK